MEWVIGVDEAGRGALAGPVAVGAVRVPDDVSWNDFPGLADSKKLSPKKREQWYAHISAHPRLAWNVSCARVCTIDTRGIVTAANVAAARAAHALVKNGSVSAIRCDAGLFVRSRSVVAQEAIIKGDETEISIALASIMAKVTRDRYMERLAHRHAVYGFEVHKGYGTKRHRDAIRNYGVCLNVHRRQFVRSLT